MIISSSIARGFREAARRPALALTLWLWSLVLGAVVALPAWSAFGGAFSLFPEADRLLDRFNLRVLFEALHYDRSSVAGAIVGTFFGAVLVALVGNSLVAGGVLDVLTTDDGRSFLHRFMRGAGHFFGRFLRLLLLAAASFLVCAVAAAMAGGLVSLLLNQAGSEMVRVLGSLVVPAAILVLFGFFSLVLDYARARMVLEGSRAAFLAWFRSLGFVLRHLLATGIVGLVFALVTAVLFVVSLLYQTGAPSNTWPLILALLVVQQLTMFLRFGLRVGSIGATVEVSNRLGNVGPLLRARAGTASAPAPAAELTEDPGARLTPEPLREGELTPETTASEAPKPEPTPGEERAQEFIRGKERTPEPTRDEGPAWDNEAGPKLEAGAKPEPGARAQPEAKLEPDA